MTAVRMTAWQRPPEVTRLPVPEPGPGEVLIEVAGAGVCHSDLHVMEWPAGAVPYDLPFTLGHETSGRVRAFGPGARSPGLDEGDAVLVYGPWGCGICPACARGAENYCRRAGEIRAAGGGLGADGGMAHHMIVPSPRLLVPIGDLDQLVAAPLTDAALTPYHAVKRSLHRLVPGTAAVVIGIGGLGHMAVQLLKALSPAEVVAVDVAEDKLDLAAEAGADHRVPAGEGAAERIRSITDGLGATLVLDCVGADATMATAAAAAAVESDVTVVGLAGGTLPVRFGAVPFEASVAIPYWGTRGELAEVVALARAGRIRPHVETHPLEQALEVYQRLRDGRVEGRAVLVPGG
ncbi:alcohol dehydrogenase catalytic domain-containing protein [Streptomyces sp. TRM43335]|uniref:alcohol dehydrogenase n=1 Tax=Streptomyces taklimakanensis TaxID=2569853 RepID=A0A6G2B6N5_9ACTN|nr:NAD(P)-dependent alcohol dehydrogenase [Streptomyces taklimakanensis]MTE17928.1 alcohol dehydrogenase catalytic domain-containing protein [Streptomyces taklimakanensis]